ncbi:MAG TPA: hypothetical protein VMJ32_10550 [Pirellulales bacterium]|nr:hypothetical protein [Pirellulales bacterium]
MNVTKDDLRDFTRFVDEKLEHGKVDSLVDLAGQWEAQRREQEETLADIRQSHADIDNNKVAPLTDSFADVRQQLGLG